MQVLRVGMAVQARRTLRDAALCAPQVLAPGDGLEVIRPHAPTVLAEVVEVEALRDRADERFVHGAVDVDLHPPADADLSVAVAARSAWPRPTAITLLDPSEHSDMRRCGGRAAHRCGGPVRGWRASSRCAAERALAAALARSCAACSSRTPARSSFISHAWPSPAAARSAWAWTAHRSASAAQAPASCRATAASWTWPVTQASGDRCRRTPGSPPIQRGTVGGRPSAGRGRGSRRRRTVGGWRVRAR